MSEDYTYRAKVGDKWLDGKKLTSDPDEAEEFESKTEPTQRINQLKKDGKLRKNVKTQIIKEAHGLDAGEEYILNTRPVQQWHDLCISREFLDAIKLSGSARDEFENFYNEFGKYPEVRAVNTKNGRWNVRFQATCKGKKVSISEESGTELVDAYVAAVKAAKAKQAAFEEEHPLAIKLEDAVFFAKDHALEFGGAFVGALCLLSAGLVTNSYLKSTEDVRHAIKEIMNNIEWDSIDYDDIHHTHGYSIGGGYHYYSGAVEIEGTKSVYRTLVKKALSKAKKTGESFESVVLKMIERDPKHFELVNKRDGILTIKIIGDTGKTKVVELDARAYMQIGNATYVYQESHRKWRSELFESVLNG